MSPPLVKSEFQRLIRHSTFAAQLENLDHFIMKKKLLFVLLGMLASLHSYAQSVGIGTTMPHPSAQLEISNPSKGLLIPRINTGALSGITNPAKGLMVYDTTKNELMVNIGTPASPNWKSIASSNWNVNGNAGTNAATHFIGTTDNAPLVFRIRNKQAGKIDSIGYQTFLGYKAGMNSLSTASLSTAIGNHAMFANTTGNSNTAVGAFALQNNTIGIMNTAVGTNAMKESIMANFNVAFGVDALEHNIGNSNSAFGNSTLKWNTTGFANTAIGSGALPLNTTGDLNVAIGRVAMFNNSTGFNNVATGSEALNRNTTGFYNAAYGDGSLYWNKTGVGNTACGSGALYHTTLSSYNTSLGYHAGFAFDLGWNNTLIGADCNADENDLFNSIALGSNVTITASNQARIGNSSTSSIGGYTSWSNISDGRYKKNIREDVKGLDFIMKLRPVTYQLDVTNLSARLNEHSEKLNVPGVKTAMAEKERIIQSGFVAQEVEQAAAASGYDFSGVDKPKNESDLYGLRYAEFVVPLVKAVQELQQQVQDLQKQVEELKK